MLVSSSSRRSVVWLDTAWSDRTFSREPPTVFADQLLRNWHRRHHHHRDQSKSFENRCENDRSVGDRDQWLTCLQLREFCQTLPVEIDWRDCSKEKNFRKRCIWLWSHQNRTDWTLNRSAAFLQRRRISVNCSITGSADTSQRHTFYYLDWLCLLTTEISSNIYESVRCSLILNTEWWNEDQRKVKLKSLS